MDDEQYEVVRTLFFKAAQIDIHCLEPHEVRALLELLPQVIVALHTEYDLFQIYAAMEQDEVP